MTSYDICSSQTIHGSFRSSSGVVLIFHYGKNKVPELKQGILQAPCPVLISMMNPDLRTKSGENFQYHYGVPCLHYLCGRITLQLCSWAWTLPMSRSQKNVLYNIFNIIIIYVYLHSLLFMLCPLFARGICKLLNHVHNARWIGIAHNACWIETSVIPWYSFSKHGIKTS